MGYPALANHLRDILFSDISFEGMALNFIRNSCEGLRFSEEVTQIENDERRFLGKSLKAGQIPYNMQMDIERLCLENAIKRFLISGKKEDAFDVYFCYLEMFIGNYKETRRMIELLSEFKSNGSGLLMKHRDHYSHSVYVFALGLAMFQSSSLYRKVYAEYYGFDSSDEKTCACHYLEFWGLTSLFHDIGYPFELPFEEICSYFEVNGDNRNDKPHIAYCRLEDFIRLGDDVNSRLKVLYPGSSFKTVNDLYAHILAEKLGSTYSFTEEQMRIILNEKPVQPEKFGNFMDHAYFSAVILFKKLFEERGCSLKKEHLDSLSAIIMHNSLYKFCIAHYKDDGNIPFNMKLHPLAFMLMLCDELQCWDRTAYGRNSKLELHPMGCELNMENNSIEVSYIFDEKESGKMRNFERNYEQWRINKIGSIPKLKAYFEMYIKNSNGIPNFMSDIQKIVDLSEIHIDLKINVKPSIHSKNKNHLSSSNFISLYNFAVVLNGRWSSDDWKKACSENRTEEYLSNLNVINGFNDSFNSLSLEYKLSNINQAKAFAEYMDKISCFYTDRQVDYEMLESFSEDELQQIEILEHKRWLDEHYDMGWEYGDPEKSQRDLLRHHKDMIPGFNALDGIVTEEMSQANYNRLDKGEQDKDTEPMECMIALLRMFDGLRIYRLK